MTIRGTNTLSAPIVQRLIALPPGGYRLGWGTSSGAEGPDVTAEASCALPSGPLPVAMPPAPAGRVAMTLTVPPACRITYIRLTIRAGNDAVGERWVSEPEIRRER